MLKINILLKNEINIIIIKTINVILKRHPKDSKQIIIIIIIIINLRSKLDVIVLFAK